MGCGQLNEIYHGAARVSSVSALLGELRRTCTRMNTSFTVNLGSEANRADIIGRGRTSSQI